MLDALEATYIQVRRNQAEPVGSPRFNPCLLIAGLLNPVVAAALLLILQAPGIPISLVVSADSGRLPALYLVSFGIAAILSVYLFDWRRHEIDSKFKQMPSPTTLGGRVLIFSAIMAMIIIEALLSSRFPVACLLFFAGVTFWLGAYVRRFLK